MRKNELGVHMNSIFCFMYFGHITQGWGQEAILAWLSVGLLLLPSLFDSS